jgi:hypothetical protein
MTVDLQFTTIFILFLTIQFIMVKFSVGVLQSFHWVICLFKL